MTLSSPPAIQAIRYAIAQFDASVCSDRPAVVLSNLRSLLAKLCPQLTDSHALLGQHAVLETVQVLAMNRRHKTPSDQAQYHAWRHVVLPYAIAQLKVLVQH